MKLTEDRIEKRKKYVDFLINNDSFDDEMRRCLYDVFNVLLKEEQINEEYRSKGEQR